MAFRRRSILILFALFLGTGQMVAANVKESRAFAAAQAMFQAKLWSRAETEFVRFRRNFPDSTNVPMAALLQAQAQFQQKKFGDAINLLKANQSGANAIEDQFVYWIGESQFASSNYLDAADTFISLAQSFSDSRLAVRSVIEAASALGQLNNWRETESLLGETNGIFLRAAQMNPADETVVRGWLLLARAKFEQNNFDGAAAVLNSIQSKTLSPQLDWQRTDLLCRVKAAAGDLPAALAATTNLFQIANLQRDDNLRAESVTRRADLLAKMGRPEDAIVAYRENLASKIPVERQREAILKIAEIASAQNELTNAGESLEDFLEQFSNAPAADMALLTLGELHLKRYAADRSATNDLQEAEARFTQFIGTFTNSPLLGKAFLDRGWCDEFEGNIPESLDDFKSAARQLPPSEDLAVAKFKIGDALFTQKDFAGARTNYDAVLGLVNIPVVKSNLADYALYQSERASLKLNDLVGASKALSQLLKHYPPPKSLPSAELLYGESLGDLQKPAAARETFGTFEQQFPGQLQPEVELAIAHTYELEHNWSAAIEKYQNWLAKFPTNGLLPRASYALAWANYQDGNETNAAALFQNFVTQFHADGLAPQAQFWLGDYFYRAKEFVNAENDYEHVYQDWPSSDLAYPAQLMAGRAAAGRGSSDAMKHFQDAFSDTNCPPDVAVQARFGYGTSLMTLNSSSTNPVANFYPATNVFARIVQMYPTNDYGALAWCYIGECDIQISDYDSATNAYAQVFNSTNINISTRSRARVGFGIALEKKADEAAPDDKKALLQQALNSYLDAFETGFGNNLAGDEKADPFWVKTAGLKALPLIQMLGVAAPDGFIDEMEKLLPQLKESLEKKRAEFSQPKT